MTPNTHSSSGAPTRSGLGQRAGTGARRSGAVSESQRSYDDEHASPPRSASASKAPAEAQQSTSTDHDHGDDSEAHGSDADITPEMPLAASRPAPPSLQRMPSQTSTDGGSSGAGSAHAANKPHHHAVHSRAHHQIHLSHHGPHHGRGPTTMRGGAGRHRSAIGLMRPPQAAAHRQGGRIGGHGRVGSSSKMVRTSTDEGVRPVIQEEIDDQQDSHEEVEEEVSSVAAPPHAPEPKEEAAAKNEPPQEPPPAAGPSAGALKKKRVPVTFVMGSMEDDSDDDEEESVRGNKDIQGQASKENRETSSSQTISKISSTDEADNSDEWASDTTTDSEDERQKAEQERKRAERERIDGMFKKIPIRSQSAADVRLLDADAQNGESNGVGQQQQVPIRSLLSTIFHPEQQHHMPQQRQGNIAEGVLRGRPHASVADLSRLQPAQSSMSTLAKLRRPSPDVAGGATGTILPRPPSVGNLGTLGSFGGLKMSKSAVALPVLSTTGSHSSTNIARSAAGGDEAASSSRARSVHGGADDSEDEYDEEDAVSGSYGGALDRLNELSRLQMNSKQKSNRPLSLRSFGSEHGHGHERRRMSGGSNASASAGTSGTSRVKRASNSSLDIQARPDLEEEEIRQQRRTSMPFESASVAAPVHLPHRSRSAVDVPDVGLPQSPRTTRRNMLRDELSESLRQNLLWERQSRHRMLGIGNLAASSAAPANGTAAATVANGTGGDHAERAGSDHPHRSSSHHHHQHPVHQQHHNHHHPHQHPQQHHHHHHHRPQSVLGGNALRPLTAHNSSSNVNNSRESKRYTGDFHQTGW